MLVRHTYVKGWYLPGGGVEKGEPAIVALERELREEGNLALDGTPVLAGVFFNRQASPRDHVVLFHVGDFRILGEKTRDLEIAEARFFPLDGLPADTTPATIRRLDEMSGRSPVSPYW